MKKTGKPISPVILPEGYKGKILLVSVSGNGIEEMVILRSGDLWHREILRNTEKEIRDLGYSNARVHRGRPGLGEESMNNRWLGAVHGLGMGVAVFRPFAARAQDAVGS